MGQKIGLIRGDGIGPEVTDATVRVVDALGLDFEWVPLPAGERAVERYGDVLPQRTIDGILDCKVALKGPVTTPIGFGFKSVNVQLRQRLNLFAAIRPVRSLPGIKTRYEDVDLVVVRENTEGLYSGIENEITDGVVTSLKVATRGASERISRAAYAYCCLRRRHKCTVFHKANIMKLSDGLFIECSRRIHETEFKDDVEYEEMIIDNGCMQLVRDPTRFDVLLLENLYGDVISDLCAAFVGGLGVVPGANIGAECSVFEAVHGSAPDIAGQNKANPLALIRSAVMMVRHLGEVDAYKQLKRAYHDVLIQAKPEELTYDLGGTGGTKEFADAIIKRIDGNI